MKREISPFRNYLQKIPLDELIKENEIAVRCKDESIITPNLESLDKVLHAFGFHFFEFPSQKNPKKGIQKADVMMSIYRDSIGNCILLKYKIVPFSLVANNLIITIPGISASRSTHLFYHDGVSEVVDLKGYVDICTNSEIYSNVTDKLALRIQKRLRKYVEKSSKSPMYV